VGDSGSTAWTNAFTGIAKTATRTQLTVTVGPVVDISNAGEMYGTVIVAEFEDGVVKAPCALADSSCDSSTKSDLHSTCTDAYCSGNLSFLVKIGKGTPTVTENTVTVPSDATCLYVQGTNFAATLDILKKNNCTTDASSHTCPTNSTSDLRDFTLNCTEKCDKAYYDYRDFRYPSNSNSDMGYEYACTPWDFDFASSENAVDLQYFDFSSDLNTGVQPEGKLLYSTSTEMCIYMTKLAQQNTGDLYLTTRLEAYNTLVTISNGQCTSYEFTRDDTADFDSATSKVGEVTASTPVLTFNNANLSSSTEYITVRGTGFDILNQSYNEIIFKDSQITASITSDWADATRTRIRFHFHQLDSRHVGDLNASVKILINSTEEEVVYSTASSNQTIATIFATSPEVYNATTVLVSGTSEDKFYVYV